jgi:hypothetical protein
MVNEDKKRFLGTQFLSIIREIDPNTSPRWGKMNTQQMIEHVSGFFRISTNKLNFPLVTPKENLPRFREFLLSEKEFRENTKAPVLPEEPLPLRYDTMEEAIADLDRQVNDFFNYFSGDLEKTTMHPVFGDLNFEEWIQLHHKHVKHHLKQFGKEI